MDIIIRHLIFFSVGVFQDILITYYYQTIAKEYAWRAAFFSTIVTLLNLLILYEILAGIEDQIFTIILAYAVGNGVGTSLVIKKHQILKLFYKKTGR
ncbi:MAG: hypothetical protein A3J93_04785 [Candidatus Magasanikbacteria bacterium RIFOXYC2_FULL_42_28]|uniref:DUF5698 domain-containing protein n=1 Tax=Candidatus Magasanikbacteria bacterium RIFOXYC2_FULL_42_28 TaxID=1798704 RepID=A0A1F6NWT2_9BACT|nr:MAG: hypothetical protein A3J93_04785 [Candidatus Magasanikbacteria bacterium RIFOXYC2_FULL_42_28]